MYRQSREPRETKRAAAPSSLPFPSRDTYPARPQRTESRTSNNDSEEKAKRAFSDFPSVHGPVRFTCSGSPGVPVSCAVFAWMISILNDAFFASSKALGGEIFSYRKRRTPRARRRSLRSSRYTFGIFWRIGGGPNNNRLIFATRNGTPWDANLLVKRKLQPILKSLGIRRCGLHAFRHANETLMDRLGVPLRAPRPGASSGSGNRAVLRQQSQ
jgi:hypothetical protein